MQDSVSVAFIIIITVIYVSIQIEDTLLFYPLSHKYTPHRYAVSRALYPITKLEGACCIVFDLVSLQQTKHSD